LNNIIQTLSIIALPLIFAITLHEAAHAFAARRFGDSTAYMLGRMTLNPIKHIDILGTIVFPIVTILISPFVFGWAKPVPVVAQNMRNPKRDMIWVAAAGPGANLFMAMMWALLLKSLGLAPDSMVIQFWKSVAQAGIVINVLFMVLNLIPLLPLDGGRIVAGLLPNKMAAVYERTEPYGMFILIALLVSGALSWLLTPAREGVMFLITRVFGLS
jgi:Zn-dependent protease